MIRRDTVTCYADAIMPKILEGAQERVGSYQTTEGQGPPDPSFVLRLPNEVYSGSNLFAVQKIFDGKFQFDIFFESGSAKQKLDGSCLLFCFAHHRPTLNSIPH
jgi:mannosyl-oligosaccharide glucosidase